ncbi:MAG: ArsC/Spx/MgsR family protein [Propionibacteriaceae bacterium]|nr:ArsC/Spx/MgsR family protein [Propionibacteriaceae bacterium]
MSDDLTILHNPRCSTSRAALEAAEASALKLNVHNYLKVPLSEQDWLEVIAKLDGDPTELVRRDPNFARSGLSDDDVRTPEQIAKVLAEHPELAQRPVLIRGDRAIIGRPKDAVGPFLGS